MTSTLADIRSYIETRVAAAYPGITIVYENVQETPPAVPLRDLSDLVPDND